MHEYLRLFVIAHKLVSYDYFMDEMQDYEIQTLSEYLQWANFAEWQQTRLLFYAALKPYLKKEMTPAQMLPLATDDQEHETEITNDQISRLKARAEAVGKMFKNNDN